MQYKHDLQKVVFSGVLGVSEGGKAEGGEGRGCHVYVRGLLQNGAGKQVSTTFMQVSLGYHRVCCLHCLLLMLHVCCLL